jgi:hypothetical protein
LVGIMTRIEVLNKIRADLAWRGPGDKPLGNIVLRRDDAEVLLAETEADAILVVMTMLARRLGELMPADERPPNPVPDVSENAGLAVFDAMVEKVVSTIAPMLHGLPPGIQLAVLADLFAIWLAGHQGAKPEIDEFRERMIQNWCNTVRELIPINERMIAEGMAESETKQ